MYKEVQQSMNIAGIQIASTMEAVQASPWDMYELVQGLWQAPSYHLLFEAILVIWIISLLFRKSYKPTRTLLSQKEKEALIQEWEPEPLVPDVPEDDPILEHLHNRIVDSKIGKYVSINGKECLNMASFNFLGMVGKPSIEETALQAIQKYGVGSCGPRGFYGTVDVHLELEDKIALFMGVEEAAVCSDGFSTIATAVPAYAKRGDMIFADEGVSFAIQKGFDAARSKVHYFKHNDMDDLERLMQEQEKVDKKNPKKAKVTRRFLVVEAIYINHGDICPLPKLVELKNKYKVRLFLDENLSFGTLGVTGRGLTEYFNINRDEVDLISASLENAMGTVGGFCCGLSYIIDHQRLSGLGYAFSASQPPLLARAGTEALRMLEAQPELVSSVQTNSQYMHEKLKRLKGLSLVGDAIAPVKHLVLAKPCEKREKSKLLLRTIVNQAEMKGIAIVQASYLEKEEIRLPPPSIRLSVNCELTTQDMDFVATTLQEICDEIVVNCDKDSNQPFALGPKSM